MLHGYGSTKLDRTKIGVNMGFFHLTARQHRWFSKLFGNINKQIIMDADEVEKLLKSTKVPVVVVNKQQEYVCPDNGKVSDILKDLPFCNAFYHKVSSGFEPDGNCVWYSKQSALKMRGYAFGVMTVILLDGRAHRINIFINRKKKVWAWEPQICSYPGGNFVREKKAIYMGIGLENVGNYPERYDDEGKKIYEEYAEGGHIF